MAQVEPMDIDAIESDFDNKENTFHHSNVLPRTPCTEKGYEELDVSELNMKLRYSTTPASSPMSKSLTGPILDNRSNPTDGCLDNIENSNLTQSLNSKLTRTEYTTKSKVLPLQTLSADPFVDSNRNSSIRRLIEPNDTNVTISVSANDIDDALSLPSTSSSVAQTPEATTPTKEIPKPGGSPILRGLKSVLSIFRSSQSPIPPADEKTSKQDILSPIESQILTSHKTETEKQSVLVSTPVAADRQKDGSSSRRSSPLKESVIFNDDLEKELQWKDETTIIFKQEKIPVHKLFFRNPLTPESVNMQILKDNAAEHNTTVEYMDVSCNESKVEDMAVADTKPSVIMKNDEFGVVESDNEFLDCETTLSKNESYMSDYKLEKEKQIKIIKDVSVDTTENDFTAEIAESACDNTVNTAECVKVSEVNIKSSEETSISLADLLKTNSDSNQIIEITKEFLKNETFHPMYDNGLHPINSLLPNDVSLQSESELSHNSSQDLNTTLVIDNKIISDVQTLDLIGINCSDSETIIDNFNVKEVPEKPVDINIEGSENVFKDGVMKIDSLPDVCPEPLTHVGYLKDNPSEITQTVKIEEIIDHILVNNNMNSSNEDVNAVKPDNCDNSAVKKDVVALFVPSSQEKSELDKSMDTQVVNEIPVVDKNTLNECALIPKDSVTNMLAIIKHKPKDEVMLITENTENNNGFPLNVTCVVDTSSSIIQPNTEQDNLKENSLDKISITEAVKKVDKPITDIPSNTAPNFLSMDNDRDISEMTVSSNMVVRKSPSEIPLPEDHAEQDIKDENNTIDEISSMQDKTFDERPSVEEIESVAKLEDSHVIDPESPEQENSKVGNNMNENGTERIAVMNQNDSYELHSYSAQNQCTTYEQGLKSEMAEDGITDTNTFNLTHSDINTNIDVRNLQNVQITIHGEEVALEEIINKDIPETNAINNICDTTTVRAENVNITDNVLNSFNTKSLENISSAEETIKSEAVHTVKIFAEKVNQGNESATVLEEIDEEIITSANNSPYVSVTDLAIETEAKPELSEATPHDVSEDIHNSVATTTKIASSPSKSPAIVSKGYNFNFDDIDDPFATKNKIRMSPTPDESYPGCDNPEKEFKKPEDHLKKMNNRRKSQPERKRSSQKKKFNSTFSGRLSTKENVPKKNVMKTSLNTSKDNALYEDKASHPQVTQYILDPKPEGSITVVTGNMKLVSQGTDQNVDESCESLILGSNFIPISMQEETIPPTNTEYKGPDQTILVSAEKSSSSSEQYFSLGTSSGESVGCLNSSKNVFNIPEIDGMNFNPFATNSKMRMSPPPVIHNTSILIADKNNVTDSKYSTEQEDYTYNKITETDYPQNISNATCSSRNTNDKNDTIRESLTEDEDTIEGPFIDSDELKDIEKLTHLEVESDMMNFDEIHPQEKDQNTENGELFIDADAFEFLLNQNKSTTVLDSGKESLFLKFDPLFAKRVSSDGVLAALSKVQKRQSTPRKITDLTQRDIVITNTVAAPSNNKESCIPVEEYNEDMSSTMTKPMMVVNPAVNSIVAPRKSTTPKINRRSLTFTSPAMAVIDRLLSLSGDTSHLNHDTSIPQHSETDLAITQLRELLAEKEIHVHNLRCESKELKDRLAALEGQLRSLETESKQRLTKINDLNERLSEKTKINKSMATVVEEYERTIASLIAESEQDRRRNGEERMRLIKERDEQTAHLASMEVSFSDLHSKYEKSKQIILCCKSNEDTYRKSIKDFEENFTKMQNNYELLKQHATSKLNYANQELEKMNRAHEAEVLKLNAMIKRKELHITSLEETLTQKTKANEELTAICDELINKVG